MKVLVFVSVLLLVAGCGSMVPMEELEAQAMLTGDWSAVEKRERAIERRKMRNGSVCPAGLIAICEGGMRADRCTCVQADVMRSLIGGY